LATQKRSWIILGLAISLLAAPVQVDAYTPKTLRVGFAPWESLQDLTKTSRDVVDLLSKELPMRVDPFVATDYTGVIEAMRAGKIDVAFFPPAAYVLAERKANAEVILKSFFNGHAQYHGAIITRKGSSVKSLSDLKDKTVAFVDPVSTSGAIYPRVMLMNAGIVPEKDFKRLIYAGGHDAAVLAVLHGKVDAAATYTNDLHGKDSAWTNSLKSAKDKAKIQLIAVTKPIPSDNIAVRKDLDPAITNQIKQVFLRLSDTPQGRKKIREIYQVDGFVEGKPADYAPVREAFDKVGFKIK
jgi:phosphonate transport system substrate-binding protein